MFLSEINYNMGKHVLISHVCVIQNIQNLLKQAMRSNTTNVFWFVHSSHILTCCIEKMFNTDTDAFYIKNAYKRYINNFKFAKTHSMFNQRLCEMLFVGFVFTSASVA